MLSFMMLGAAVAGAAWFLNWSGLKPLAAARGVIARAKYGPTSIDWLVVRLAVGAARRGGPWGETPGLLIVEASAGTVDMLQARSHDLQARVEAPLARVAIRRGATLTRPVVQIRRADLPPGHLYLRFEHRDDGPARETEPIRTARPVAPARERQDHDSSVLASEARTRHAGATLAMVGGGAPAAAGPSPISLERTMRRALLRLQDAGQARELEVHEGLWKVGRSITNEITLEDPEVSREAVRIVVGYEGVWIEAASSNAAIRLNTRAIRGRERIGDGDRIWLSRRAWVDIVQAGGPAA